MNKYSEIDMVNFFIKKEIDDSWKYITERKCEGTRIDLIFKNNKFLYACEFKKNNFEKLFRQGLRLKTFFNKVYLCIPNTMRDIKKKKEICQEYNIGLILFNIELKKFDWIYEPKMDKIICNIRNLKYF